MKNIPLNTIETINNDNIYAHVTEKAKEETGQKFAQYVNF